MTEERPQRTFQKGDVVRVVDEPYEDCPFEWISEMDECCGKEARITDVIWLGHLKAYGYTIDIDEYGFTWCENCFDSPIPDIEESDEDISTLFV